MRTFEFSMALLLLDITEGVSFIYLVPVFLWELSLLLADIFLLSKDDGLVCGKCAVIWSGGSFCRGEQGSLMLVTIKVLLRARLSWWLLWVLRPLCVFAFHCYSRNTLFFLTKDLPLPVVQQLHTVQIAQCFKKKKKQHRNLPAGWVHLVQYSIFAYFLDCTTKTPAIRHPFQEELREGRSWKALAWLASKSIRAHLPHRHRACCIWSTCSVL